MRGIRFRFKCSVCSWRGYREDKEDRINRVKRKPCPSCQSAVIPVVYDLRKVDRRLPPWYKNWAPELESETEE